MMDWNQPVIKKVKNGWSQGLLIFAGILWVALLAAGFTLLEREEFTPVANAPVTASFPANSAIQLAADKPTLLLFFHPHCPCSRASLHELDGLLTETQNKLSVILIFTIPKGVPPGWEEGDLWKSAAAMPGVRVLRDQGGLEARRFGVTGSGHTLLYNPSGQLLFSGGITPSRGHEGDNAGRSAIIDFVLTGHSLVKHASVFGCSLL
jgi:hypothetical protein